jgi:hypothetical protein
MEIKKDEALFTMAKETVIDLLYTLEGLLRSKSSTYIPNALMAHVHAKLEALELDKP